ncbi:MAG: hypothetical protein AUJ02_02510 [Chloroflexi bacterium 13_1_40CM_3_65_12]|nr:MAG: hypothetical protein AUH40_08805 [Chloroflexi bacterium 13_1_40CM_65_17]OLD26440.1 MAG: hypothetical protein AUJ02_02510 [Chloroflexi bacterium 13_1_40CM_3_65_12]
MTPSSRAGATVKQAAAQPWLEVLERLGYVVRGLVYGLMGWLAFQLAMGGGGTAIDQAGSIVILAGTPLGRPILLMVVIGLAAYSLWGFVRAIFDPWRRGTDASGIAQRLGYAWSGFAYATLAMFALHLFASGRATAIDSTQAAVRSLLTYPTGRLLAVFLGILTIGAGIAQFVDARKAFSQAGVVKEDTPPEVRRPLLWLGRFGMFSRGVVFMLVGWFVIQAGLHRDPASAHGFQGAFTFLLAQPYGHLFLAVVALGFIALGLHSLALARWARLLRSS